MDLVTPDLGLLFWTGIVFCTLLFLLAKFAWKPILNAVNEREKSISDALELAEKTREEMKSLKAENDQILKQAKIERDEILKDAKSTASSMIEKAKNKAKDEFNLSAEHLIHGGQSVAVFLTRILNGILKDRRIPKFLKTAINHPIPKKNKDRTSHTYTTYDTLPISPMSKASGVVVPYSIRYT